MRTFENALTGGYKDSREGLPVLRSSTWRHQAGTNPNHVCALWVPIGYFQPGLIIRAQGRSATAGSTGIYIGGTPGSSTGATAIANHTNSQTLYMWFLEAYMTMNSKLPGDAVFEGVGAAINATTIELPDSTAATGVNLRPMTLVQVISVTSTAAIGQLEVIPPTDFNKNPATGYGR